MCPIQDEQSTRARVRWSRSGTLEIIPPKATEDQTGAIEDQSESEKQVSDSHEENLNLFGPVDLVYLRKVSFF